MAKKKDSKKKASKKKASKKKGSKKKVARRAWKTERAAEQILKELDAPVTAAELGSLLGYSSRWINKLVAENVIFRSGPNKFMVIESLVDIFRDGSAKRELLEAQGDDTRERAMLTRTKRQQLQGELIYSDDVTAGTSQLVVGLVKIHDELERNIKRRLPNVPDEVMEEVKKASNWARTQGAKLCETGTFELTDETE
jgi:hypothetical protein